MDKFDESIKQAKQTYEPNNNFVEATMQQITRKQPRKRWNLKFWAPVLVGGLAIIALVFVALPNSSTTNDSVTPYVHSSTNVNTPSTAAQTPAAGTDDASLTSDLNDINSAVNQENSDQTGANSALNDSAQQITVPTD